MARKKQDDVIRNALQQLDEALQRAREKRAEMAEWLQRPSVAAVLTMFESDAERMKETLVNAETKTVVALQQGVLARRALLTSLREAYLSEVADAEKALVDFRQQNELLVSAAEVAESAPATGTEG